MRTAIYAGSFDPVTLGHVDVIRRATALFDRVIVAAGRNPAKRYLFEEGDRIRLLHGALAGLPVEVIVFEGLLVRAAAEHRASVILRGLRGAADFEAEHRYAIANRQLSGIETMFIVSDPQLAHVSSSLVKEIASNGGAVDAYVPVGVAAALRERYPVSPVELPV